MYIFIQPRCCSPINCIYSFSGFLHAAYKNWNCCITFCLWSQCCFPSIPFCFDSWVCVFRMCSAAATFSSYSQTIFIIITTPPIHCILNCIAWFMCWHWIEPLVVGIPDLPQLRCTSILIVSECSMRFFLFMPTLFIGVSFDFCGSCCTLAALELIYHLCLTFMAIQFDYLVTKHIDQCSTRQQTIRRLEKRTDNNCIHRKFVWAHSVLIISHAIESHVTL